MNVETISSAPRQKDFNSNSKKLDTVEVEAMDMDTDTLKSQNPPETTDNNALRYDPDAITAFYNKRPLKVWKRQISILWTFVLFAFSWWLDKVTGNTTKNERSSVESKAQWLGSNKTFQNR